jgi:ubiquitin-like-conjugating enzyme ATG10
MASLTPSRPSQESLLCFPFLTADEFDYGCRVLCDRFHAWQISSPDTGLSIQFVHQQVTSDSMLKISRYIENIGVHDEENVLMHEPEDLQEPQLEDDSELDPEALIRATKPIASLQVDYDIALSPTYQVPVLHFTLRWTNHKGPMFELDAIYQYLVPDEYRRQLKNVGIIGGISFDVGAMCFSVPDRFIAHSSTVSSNNWRAHVLRPPLQYRRCYETHCGGAGCHTRDVSRHLARVGRTLRWLAYAV